MDVEAHNFEAHITPEVQAILANRAFRYSHGDLWRLIQAWYDHAGQSDNETLGQCAYELSALIGPLAYA